MTGYETFGFQIIFAFSSRYCCVLKPKDDENL